LKKYISITPLHLNLTHRESLEKLQVLKDDLGK